MNPMVRIATHLGAVAVGLAIAGSVVGFSKQESPAETTVPKSVQGRTAGSAGESVRGEKGGSVTRISLKKSDFQQAWDSLASRPLSRTERVALQMQILKKWAQVDLAGAMDEALKEPWDRSEDPFAGDDLMDAFSEAFTDRPLDAWALIQSGRYGAGAYRLRSEWLNDVSQSNGLLVISMLSGMPDTMQDNVVGYCLGETTQGPARDAIMAKLVEQTVGKPAGWLEEIFRFNADILSDGDPASLRNQWAGLPEGTQRRVAMLEWSASLRNRDAQEVSTELANLPPDAKVAATKLLLSQMDGDSRGILAVIESAMSSDQWGSMAESAASELAYFTRMDPAKLAEWGTNLPQRTDTVEIYHKAIGRYIRDDLPRAKEWLGAMAEGSWQRENGLAEFSQQALLGKNDPASSQWALDSISDSAVKAEATKWRHDWEEQMR